MHYLIIIILSLLLSFFFSGTETAFVSVNKVRVEVWRRRKERAANIILNFLTKPERFLYTTLVGNNIFNIAFASYATIYFRHYLNPRITWLLILVLTLLVGEIFPKTLFRSLASWIVRKIVYPLNFFYYLFYPFIYLVSKISEFLLSLLGIRGSEVRDFFSRKDIEILLHEGQEDVRFRSPREGELLRRLLAFRELRVREAMVPRTDMVVIRNTVSLQELIAVFQKYGCTRIPVYQGNLDNIIGIIFLKDLFLDPKTLDEMLRPAMMVPETKRCSDLLREFREQNTTMAIVIDEYGGTAGLVTTEDLLEELLGEIEDEYDAPTVLIRKMNQKIYSVNARIEIARLNRELGIKLPEGEYETLAGFLLSSFGHIPRRDERVKYDGIEIVVTRSTRRKVEWVRMILP